MEHNIISRRLVGTFITACAFLTLYAWNEKHKAIMVRKSHNLQASNPWTSNKMYHRGQIMKTIKLMHQVLWISYATREENYFESIS